MDTIRPVLAPSIPHDLDTLGISKSFVTDLVLRRISTEGTSSLASLCRALKLSLPIIDTVFRHFWQQQWLDVKAAAGEDYTFSLTTLGRQLASARMENTQYAGPAPVSLYQYTEAVRAQSAKVILRRHMLEEILSDMVLTDRLLDQLGPAVVSQRSLFLYGPTGNGKTSLAERVLRAYRDVIIVPYALEVDNQVINLYDPMVHQRVDGDYEHLDPRWVVCRRPSVTVGGELVSSMLELRLDEASKIYAAPLQMKANNGVLVIDDFGRQVMSPRELLNRWIVPLDRRVDYLSLRYGVKFEIPFDLMVVFATNLDPSSLADEAFLRRIHNKIYVGAVDATVFDQIFDRLAKSKGIQCEPDIPAYLRNLCFQAGCTELRACIPGDILSILQWISSYRDEPPVANRQSIHQAVSLYFTHTEAFTDEG